MKEKLEFHLNHLLKLGTGCIALFVICAILSRWIDFMAYISMVFAGMSLAFALSSVLIDDGVKDALKDAEKDCEKKDDEDEEKSFLEKDD